MMKPVTFAVVAALIAAGAVVSGAVTQRWSVFESNPELTKKLHAHELRFEDWQATAVPTEMPTNERSIATSRRYTSPRTGHGAAISIFSGIPGSVSTHTPDVCYPGSGYKTLRSPRKDTLTLANGDMVEFYVADFEKKTETKHDRARVRWAWSTDGKWVAPDSPRWQFARQLASVPVLYKLYIVTAVPESNGETRAEDDGLTQSFVRTAWSQYSELFAK